jgi:hypothetical protein
VASEEVACRVHAVERVAEAMDAGEWDADVEALDLLGELLDGAARWALVVELEGVAA